MDFYPIGPYTEVFLVLEQMNQLPSLVQPFIEEVEVFLSVYLILEDFLIETIRLIHEVFRGNPRDYSLFSLDMLIISDCKLYDSEFYPYYNVNCNVFLESRYLSRLPHSWYDRTLGRSEGDFRNVYYRRYDEGGHTKSKLTVKNFDINKYSIQGLSIKI